MNPEKEPTPGTLPESSEESALPESSAASSLPESSEESALQESPEESTGAVSPPAAAAPEPVAAPSTPSAKPTDEKERDRLRKIKRVLQLRNAGLRVNLFWAQQEILQLKEEESVLNKQVELLKEHNSIATQILELELQIMQRVHAEEEERRGQEEQ